MCQVTVLDHLFDFKILGDDEVVIVDVIARQLVLEFVSLVLDTLICSGDDDALLVLERINVVRGDGRKCSPCCSHSPSRFR
jgi:hypothetical protein